MSAATAGGLPAPADWRYATLSTDFPAVNDRGARFWSVVMAAGTMACAVSLTHVFWHFFRYTPFLLMFAASVLTAAVAGRTAGLLTVAFGVVGYGLSPLPLPQEGVSRLLGGYAIISASFSWVVARQRYVEAELRAGERRLQEAQELAHVGNWRWDIASGRFWGSNELYRIFGRTPGSIALSDAAFLELIHPDDRAAVDAALRSAAKEKQPYAVEHRIVRPDGEVRVVHGQGRVVSDERGRVIRVVGAMQDVTARKVAEQVVSASERRLQTIIDAEPACVKLVSRDGRLLEMNRAGLDMIGARTFAQVKGYPVLQLVHAEDRGRFLDAHRAASDGAPSRLEFAIVRLDGRERQVDAHMVPFDIPEGAGVQRVVLSVTSDVTERKQLEDQLRQSQKLEAVGLLAGGIAHDFNNLLTAIGGYTDFVLETFDSVDRRKEDLQEVAKAAKRGAALTRQLLAVSRRQILQPTVLDVNAMVSDVQNLLRRTIPENIKLQLELNAVEPVRADRGQLEQVVLNLAINAGDAMPDGGLLRLATETVDVDEAEARRRPPMPAARYMRVTVTDSGTGMPPETQARIFEPFFTTKPRGKGTGLGLATVYGIIKQSGGFIWVDSQVGRGTTFQIYLPVVYAPVESTTETAPVRDLTGGSQTILLAEDDGAVRRLARDVLSRHGYDVLEARDGDEALGIARAHSGAIDLLITDVVMPGLSGRDLADRLKEYQPSVRVLYTSGYTENIIMRNSLEGDLRLLAKPFLPSDLLRTVAERFGDAAA
jgi:PAS domain S-box-containing protein